MCFQPVLSYRRLLRRASRRTLLQSRFANSVGDRRASSTAENEHIVDAIEASDAAAAATAMTKDLDHVQSALASLSPAAE